MTAFLDYLQFQARSRPQAQALMTPKASLSYEELVGRARSITRFFANHRLQTGDIVCGLLLEKKMHVCAIVAAMASGITTFSVAGQRPTWPGKLTVSAILTDHPVSPAVETRTLR